MPTTELTPHDFDSIRTLQKYCGENSTEHGFRTEGLNVWALANALRTKTFSISEDDSLLADQVESGYASKRLNLIHDELAEAHEELRNGKAVAEEYVNTSPGKEGKPEGIPSEIADVIIRALDLADEFGIDIAAVIEHKLAYNASREAMHGGRKF